MTIRIAVFAAVALLAGESGAQTPPAAEGTPAAVDTLRLTNGGFLRGAVIEFVPGDRYRIRLLDGEVRTVPAGEVAHFEEGRAAPAPTAAPVAPSIEPQAAVPAATSPTLSTVDFETEPVGERIEMVTGSAVGGLAYTHFEGRRLLCISPCRAEIPPGTYEFRVGSRRIRAIEIGSGSVRLHLHSVTQGSQIGAWVLLGVGSSVIVGGLLLLAPWNWGSPTIAGSTQHNVGLVLLVIGTAMAVFGGALAGNSTYTLDIRGNARLRQAGSTLRFGLSPYGAAIVF